MKLLKKLKFYLGWEGIVLPIIFSAILGLITNIPISLGAFEKTFNPVVAIFTFSFFLFFMLFLFTLDEKAIERRAPKRLDFLKELIGKNKLRLKRDGMTFKKLTDNEIVTFTFSDKKSLKILELSYDTEEKKFIKRDVSKNLIKYSHENVDLIVDQLCEMIQQQYGYRNNHTVGKNDDEVIVGIDTLRDMCLKLNQEQSNFSFEEKHLLKESIPSELARLRDIYLSFSPERKIKNAEVVKENMREIKKAIDVLGNKIEDEKENKLLEMSDRIREKITKRL